MPSVHDRWCPQTSQTLMNCHETLDVSPSIPKWAIELLSLSSRNQDRTTQTTSHMVTCLKTASYLRMDLLPGANSMEYLQIPLLTTSA